MVALELKDEVSQAVMKPVGAEGYDYTYVHHADAGLSSRIGRRMQRPDARTRRAVDASSTRRTTRCRRAADRSRSTPRPTDDRADQRPTRRNGQRQAASTTTAPTRSRSSRASRRCASGPAMYIGSTGAAGPAPPRLRGRRQLDRRGAGRLLRPDQRHDPHRRLGHRRRQRPRHSGRPARERPLGGRGRPDRAARRRQVRQRQLQGVGRPARRRRLGGQRALGDARPRDLAQRPGLPAELRARQADARPRDHGHDEEARHEDHVQARHARSSRRSSSASTRWRSACASWRS